MKLHPEGREYWTPTTTTLPVGYTLFAARFVPAGAWIPFVTVSGAKSILVAGPGVVETPNPAGTVVLPLGRSVPDLKLVDTTEVLIRTSPDAIDVHE